MAGKKGKEEKGGRRRRGGQRRRRRRRHGEQHSRLNQCKSQTASPPQPNAFAFPHTHTTHAHTPLHTHTPARTPATAPAQTSLARTLPACAPPPSMACCTTAMPFISQSSCTHGYRQGALGQWGGGGQVGRWRWRPNRLIQNDELCLWKARKAREPSGQHTAPTPPSPCYPLCLLPAPVIPPACDNSSL